MNRYLDVFAQFDRAEKLNQRIPVRTSGSTGSPRSIFHEWETLKQTISTQARFRGWVWATSFDLDTYAGMQVALQAWATGGSLMHFDRSLDSALESLRVQKPQALCCTPSFLSLLLHTQSDLSFLKPRQITLGGEPFRPALASQTRARFPTARITLIYANSEFGVLMKTHRLDGWYEVKKLDKRHCWRVNSGVLEILQNSRWISTGDLVEERGSLLRILGRVDSVANVGGNKINLDYIRDTAEQVPGVRQAWCYPTASPILGQVVGIDIAPAPGFSYDVVKSQVESCLRARFPKPAWPRLWRHANAVVLGKNGKSVINF